MNIIIFCLIINSIVFEYLTIMNGLIAKGLTAILEINYSRILFIIITNLILRKFQME